MIEIISKSNDIIKHIKSLNEKKYRKISNSFYLEGIKIVSEILDRIESNKISSSRIKNIIFSEELINKTNEKNKEALIKKLEKIGNFEKIKIIKTNENILKYITDTVTPQGVIIELEKEEISLDILTIDKKNNIDTILLVDSVQDAGNLGTIIRTANAFLVKNIICTDNTVDVYSPKVLRSTMGAILDTNIVCLNKELLTKKLLEFKDSGYNIITTSLEAEKQIEQIDFSNKKIFVVGNESNGVSKDIIKLSTENIIIPMESTQESLNVGVATGILLYSDYNFKIKARRE